MKLASCTSSPTRAPEFGDYAAEYEEWGLPQRAAAQHLVAEMTALPQFILDPSNPSGLCEMCQPVDASPSPGANALHLLDIGAGTGFIRDALDRAGWLASASLLCLDTSLSMLRYGAQKPGFRPLAGDATDLPLAAQSMDHIFSSFTIHWLPAPGKFFREARRVLRPGGTLHVAVPVFGSLAGFRSAILPIAAGAGYQLDLDVYPEGDDLMLDAMQAGFSITRATFVDFNYRPETVRDMLAFMRYAGASRLVRPRHSGDFLRFAIRLVHCAKPEELKFHMLMMHARKSG